jgi:hypothetical protein
MRTADIARERFLHRIPRSHEWGSGVSADEPRRVRDSGVADDADTRLMDRTPTPTTATAAE